MVAENKFNERTVGISFKTRFPWKLKQYHHIEPEAAMASKAVEFSFPE